MAAPYDRIGRTYTETLLRVARVRVVVFSWDPSYADRQWLGRDYFPSMADDDNAAFPALADQAAELEARVDVVPVPWDCRDGFGGAGQPPLAPSVHPLADGGRVTKGARGVPDLDAPAETDRARGHR